MIKKDDRRINITVEMPAHVVVAEMKRRANEAKKCLQALSNAYKDDGFVDCFPDLMDELNYILEVLEGRHSYEGFCSDNLIDPENMVFY